MAKKQNKKDDLFHTTNKAIDKLLDGHEKDLATEYVDTLSNIKTELAGAYEKFGADGVLTREEMLKYGRLSKLETFLVDEIQTLTNTQVRLTKDSIRNTFTESYYRYGYMIENKSELAIYKMLKPEIVDNMLFNELDLVTWDERVRQNNQVLVRQLREELAMGLVQGLGYAAMARQVSKRLNIGLNKAKVITRTECRRVQEQANLSTLKEAKSRGVIEQKRWVATLDKRTRDSHGSLDGQVVDVDDYFVTSSGAKALAPHQFGIAKEDIHCRCTMIAVITVDGEVLGQDKRRTSGEITGHQTYSQWKEGLQER